MPNCKTIVKGSLDTAIAFIEALDDTKIVSVVYTGREERFLIVYME